jgi:CheY-like chemotaxis protein/anti-sigma regulatory factor (Ser/Thr protein kinase)
MSEAAARSLVVLVVDDDEDQRFLLRRLLGRAGITQVHEAADGAEAPALLSQHRPDLIVLDLAMPLRSGVDVLPELRELAPGVPVVVVSNLSRRRWEATTRDLGAVGFVEKRTPPNRLVAEILMAAALLEHVTDRISSQLSQEPTAPRAARQVIRAALADDDATLLESVELLVSELVTNSVIHASSAPRLELVLLPDRVRVEVHDDDPRLPAHRTPDEERPGGRGLHLLDAVATAWGAEPAGEGKVVWFELERGA